VRYDYIPSGYRRSRTAYESAGRLIDLCLLILAKLLSAVPNYLSYVTQQACMLHKYELISLDDRDAWRRTVAWTYS
jgi:hypothetical protein